MSYSAVLPLWTAIRERFMKKVNTLTEEELTYSADAMTIGQLLYHTAEVEYMFADWFFGQQTPSDMVKTSTTDLAELKQLLIQSNNHLIQAMEQLSDVKWHATISSRIGESTPLEAVGRLIYHTGIHVGQISTIQKLPQHTQEGQ